MNKTGAVLVFICEKWESTQFSTEALIGLLKVYNHGFLYRIVGSMARGFSELLHKDFSIEVYYIYHSAALQIHMVSPHFINCPIENTLNIYTGPF